MQHTHIPVGRIENIGPVRLTGYPGIAPVHLDFLARVAGDGRNFHPYRGCRVSVIPLLNLIGKRRARHGGKPDVAAVAPGLGEVENVSVEPHQQRKIGFRGPGGEVGPVRSGQDEQGGGVSPCIVGRYAHGVGLGGDAVFGGDGIVHWIGKVPGGTRSRAGHGIGG